MKRKQWKYKALLPQAAAKRRALVFGIMALLFSWVVLGGNKGVVALVSSWQEKRTLENEIAALQQSNKDLVEARKSLEENPGQNEKTAREKLMLSKPGELIYRFDPGEGG